LLVASSAVVDSFSGGLAPFGSNRVDRGYAGAVKTTEQMVAEARKVGIEVVVTTRLTSQSEITLLPSVRRAPEEPADSTEVETERP
jgi:hypothetical protein